MKIEVKVHAQSGKNEVIEKSLNSFIVYTTKAPQRGTANKEITKMLAKHFHVTQKQVIILRGEKSNKKTIQIDN